VDPLAHTLTGVVLAKSGIERRVGAGSLFALILASNLVDIDIFGALFIDEPTWTFRRMWTHSLFTAPFFVLLASFIFSRLYKNASWFRWTLVFSLGAVFHIGMDLINSYGVVLLFPFSRERFELAWVFIIDLYIWGILILALLSPFVARKFGYTLNKIKCTQLGVFGLLLYLGFCGVLRHHSQSLIASAANKDSISHTFAYVFPEPFGPWRFRGVLRAGDEYKVYLIKPLRGSVEYKKSFFTEESEASVANLRDSESGRKYSWFFKAPVWKKKSEVEAVVSDLRFKYLLLDREGPFTYTVRAKP
jgi:inner membrane protein